ncbi:outer membrane protein assembly factor BamA [Methylovirgula sp. HY1]|uniref:outer membrane protein assembly factor BamA n=1 Tax=Methylovirgula sp. HY1 TaxID=2822761 RepID=UPI001C5B9FD4|nr:outer membrane protein assembly factor BamA [Methylovirgula sp. HY1]QXX73652.1 Outer membrane protein assembly factor BamA [Methylovirgula sp. HY1]
MRFLQSHFFRLFFLLAVLAPVFMVAPAHAQTIQVEGNQRVDSETIRSYFAGTTPAAINKGVKDLYATGLFSEVRIVHAGRGIVVHVAENKVINRVVFQGNSKIKAEQLTTAVQSKSRGPFSQTIVEADVQRIKDLYRRMGQAAAVVTYRTVDLPNGRIDVVFTIKEGDKTGVKDIVFIGNHAFSSGKLRDLMQTTEMNWLSFFKTSDVYDPDKIASDLELIRRFYLKNGYADFRVIGSDARYDSKKGGYIITITVEEGVQYRVAAVDIESHLPAISAASLRPFLRFGAGGIYNGDLVQKTTEALTKEIMRRGYAFSQVHPRGDRDPATRTVKVVFVIDQGPRVYVERIEIRGNTRTRDYVIRREFDIAEGDAYNKVLLDEGERRLNNLGFFKKVKITTEPGSESDRVIVVVTVQDKPTGSFSVSGGYSTMDGIIGQVAIQETNFMGRGEFVRLALSGGQYSKGITFSFTEPYFLGQRVAAGFDVYAKDTSVSPFTFYNNFMVGGTLRLGLPITDQITFQPRYSVYSSYISIPNSGYFPYNDCNYPILGLTPYNQANGQAVPGFPQATGPTATNPYGYSCLTNGEASLALKQAQGTYITSMPGFTLSYNSLDNNKDPTSGIHAQMAEDFAGAGGNEHYLRTTADFRYYQSLWEELNIVGLVHLQGGYLQSVGSGNSLRIIDNFVLGPTLVRGFAPAGIGPRDISGGMDAYGNPLGGTKYWGASLETQFPIWGVPKEVGLRGAVFADAGALWGYSGQTNFAGPNGTACFTCAIIPYDTFPYYTQGNTITVGASAPDIRTSVGVSLIWASPLGPIRFDFAKVITKAAYDQTQFFNFTGGTTF